NVVRYASSRCAEVGTQFAFESPTFARHGPGGRTVTLAVAKPSGQRFASVTLSVICAVSIAAIQITRYGAIRMVRARTGTTANDAARFSTRRHGGRRHGDTIRPPPCSAISPERTAAFAERWRGFDACLLNSEADCGTPGRFNGVSAYE